MDWKKIQKCAPNLSNIKSVYWNKGEKSTNDVMGFFSTFS